MATGIVVNNSKADMTVYKTWALVCLNNAAHINVTKINSSKLNVITLRTTPQCTM